MTTPQPVMTWTLHDSTGPIRSGIKAEEAVELLLSNMRHEDGPNPCFLVSEGNDGLEGGPYRVGIADA